MEIQLLGFLRMSLAPVEIGRRGAMDNRGGPQPQKQLPSRGKIDQIRLSHSNSRNLEWMAVVEANYLPAQAPSLQQDAGAEKSAGAGYHNHRAPPPTMGARPRCFFPILDIRFA